MTTFESNVKQIAYPQQTVYDTLSDLTHLQGLKDRMEAIKGQLTDEQRKQAEQLNNLTFDADSLSIEAPMVGTITLRVIDREPLKTIKFETEMPQTYTADLTYMAPAVDRSTGTMSVKAKINNAGGDLRDRAQTLGDLDKKLASY